jgi:hypothetical protein
MNLRPVARVPHRAQHTLRVSARRRRQNAAPAPPPRQRDSAEASTHRPRRHGSPASCPGRRRTAGGTRATPALHLGCEVATDVCNTEDDRRCDESSGRNAGHLLRVDGLAFAQRPRCRRKEGERTARDLCMATTHGAPPSRRRCAANPGRALSTRGPSSDGSSARRRQLNCGSCGARPSWPRGFDRAAIARRRSSAHDCCRRGWEHAPHRLPRGHARRISPAPHTRGSARRSHAKAH